MGTIFGLILTLLHHALERGLITTLSILISLPLIRLVKMAIFVGSAITAVEAVIWRGLFSRLRDMSVAAAIFVVLSTTLLLVEVVGSTGSFLFDLIERICRWRSPEVNEGDIMVMWW